MIAKLRIETAHDMILFGCALGAAAQSPDSLWLTGPLGAGKTTFAKGFLDGLGAVEAVTSPSFLVAKEHPGARIPAVHIDLFRINSLDKFCELGLEEYFGGEWFVVCEWADRLRFDTSGKGLHIEFEIEKDGGRLVTAAAMSGAANRPIIAAAKEYRGA